MEEISFEEDSFNSSLNLSEWLSHHVEPSRASQPEHHDLDPSLFNMDHYPTHLHQVKHGDPDTLLPSIENSQPRLSSPSPISFPVDPPPSIFGPRVVQIKSEVVAKAGSYDDLYGPATPLRQPRPLLSPSTQPKSLQPQSRPPSIHTPDIGNSHSSIYTRSPYQPVHHPKPSIEVGSKAQPTQFNASSKFHNIFSKPDSTRISTVPQHSTQNADVSINSIVDSDDEDPVIIEPGTASLEAQERWSEHRQLENIQEQGSQGSQASSIKKEPGVHDTPISFPGPPGPPPRVAPTKAQILATQRAMLPRPIPGLPNATPGANRPRRLIEAEVIISGSPAATRKRQWDGQIVESDPAQIDAAMGAGIGADHDWMHKEPEEELDEVGALRDKIQDLERMKKNGKISEGLVFELGRLKKQMRLKEKLLRCANKTRPAEEEEEPSLFVPEAGFRDETLRLHRMVQPQPRSDTPAPGGGEVDDQDEDEAIIQMLQESVDGDGLDTMKETTSKPKKPRKKAAKNAREVFARQAEERRERERAKAQKQKARQAANGGRGRKAAAKGKPGAAKNGKRAKAAVKVSESLLTTKPFRTKSGLDEIGQMMINDLINNDPINDRLQNPIFDVAPEPAIDGDHAKSTQLQRLLANIPEGSNTSQAKSDERRLREASMAFGYAQVKAVDGKWLIKGMQSTLYHHQLLGAQWMIQRELSDDAPYGGILADGMGLGKTVQTLACMVGNPPQPHDLRRGVKATLIVVPSSVIDQWQDEIGKHVKVAAFPKVMHYRAAYKIPMEVLKDLDIVVTSYQEVMRQFPYPDAETRAQRSRLGYKKWLKRAQSSMGDLLQVYWYRVVLDESHLIKNNSSRTSLACQSLRSIYRWCLTGTPLLNKLEELFPYLRFLKANYSMDFKTFQRYFCDPAGDECNARIATLLSYTMMRRTMKTTILNRAIITLPPPHPEIRFVQFSDEERVIYRITENRFRANLNAYFAKGTASKNCSVILVYLLRLRQCTSHSFMLESTIKESWTSSDVQELLNRLKALGKANIPFYEQCKVWVSQSEEARERGEVVGVEGVGDEAPSMPFGHGDYGHSFNMSKNLATLNEKELFSRVTCGICSDLPRDPLATDCGHICCRECLMVYIHDQAARGDVGDYLICPACNKVFSSFKPYKGIRVRDDDDNNNVNSESSATPENNTPSNKRQKRTHAGSGSLGRDALGFEPNVMNSTWVNKSDHDKDCPLVPSAKTAALKAILLKGFADAPMDKVVIYVQFRLLARIVGRICAKEGWGFVYLTGDSSLDHRSHVVKLFREDASVKILIAGLKCGGLGLNFPWANRCISLDLWWNHAIEQQAFGRIFRMGQMKETYMTRIIVKNTVDMRLLTMQMHKLRACDRVMEGGDKEKNLSLRELAQLFGFLRTDDEGNIISVEADYEDEDGGVGGGVNVSVNGGSGDADADGSGSVTANGSVSADRGGDANGMGSVSVNRGDAANGNLNGSVSGDANANGNTNTNENVQARANEEAWEL